MEDTAGDPDASTVERLPVSGRTPKGRLWRSVYRIVRLVVVAYAALCVLAFFAHPRLLYHPIAATGPMPATLLRRGGEDFRLSLQGGIRVHGWRIPPGRADGVGGALLAFHGNAGNLSTASIRLALYSDLGCDVYMVDYPGYGLSGGTPGEAALYESAEALWNHVTTTRGYRPEEVAILGYSLGGAVASWLAQRHPEARGLVLESTFTSLADVAGDFFPFLPCRLILGGAYDTLSRLDAITVPLLVVHGEGDELVGYHHGRRLYQSYGGRKRFLRIGNDHNVGFMARGDSYERGLEAFLGDGTP